MEYKNKNITNCEYVIEQAEELKALLSYNSERMIRANEVRALSAIDVAISALNELKSNIESITGIQKTNLGVKQCPNYYVSYKIDARFVVGVHADNTEDAMKKANDVYLDADFGEASDITGDIIIVEDENGEYVWEK